MSAEAAENNRVYLGRALRWLELALANLPRRPDESPSGEVMKARAELDLAASAVPPPPLIAMADGRIPHDRNYPPSIRLSDFERDLLLLCVAVEIEPALGGLCAKAQGDANRRHPNFELARRLLGEPDPKAFSRDGALRYYGLIEVFQPGGISLVEAPLRADERVTDFVRGFNHLDDQILPWITPVGFDDDSAALSRSQKDVVDEVLEALGVVRPGPVVQLVGGDEPTARRAAWHVALAGCRTLYRLAAEDLPAAPGELERLIRLWERERRLLPLALYVDAYGAEVGPGPSGSVSLRILDRFLARSRGLVMVSSRERLSFRGRPSLIQEVNRPTSLEQRMAWSEALGLSVGASAPAELAAQFSLDIPTIAQLAKESLQEVELPPNEVRDRAWNLCRRTLRPRLDSLAERIDARATFDDIVLPAEKIDLLEQVIDQVFYRGTVYEDWGFARTMNRGLGISVLFAGDSGTGKTMAAEVLASALQLDLFRIDLATVVSKYIGETEKNLRALFDAAESGGSILFFDEADALFGRRSEVKDSHDRYANIEIDYLLQRMESYRGLAILATNMKDAIDTAFLRRLRFVVDFPFPSAEDQMRMWKRVLPARDAQDPRGPILPVGQLDYARLSKLNLTGASIHSVAMGAAFLAAAEGEPIGMREVCRALRAEAVRRGQPSQDSELCRKILAEAKA
jgi:ATPase family associated with various cellular activities (AAA)